MPPARRFRAFIEFAYRDKAWLLATSVIVAAVSFLGHFVSSVPRTQADDEVMKASLLAQHAEVETAAKIGRRAWEAVFAYYDVIDRYNKGIGDHTNLRHLTGAWFAESFRQLREVRNKVNVTAGVFQGTHLSDPTLEVHRAELITNLERMDSTLKLLEQYYVNLRTCGAELTEVQQHLKDDVTQSEATANRQMSAFDGWDAAVSGFTKRHHAEWIKLKAHRQQNHGKAIVAFLALAAITTYIFVAFRAVTRVKPPRKR